MGLRKVEPRKGTETPLPDDTTIQGQLRKVEPRKGTETTFVSFTGAFILN